MIILESGSEIILHPCLLIMVKLDDCCVYALSVDDTWKAESIFWDLSGHHLFAPNFNTVLPFQHDIELLRDLVYSATQEVISKNQFIAPLICSGQLRPVGHEYLHSQKQCPCRSWCMEQCRCRKKSDSVCKCRMQLWTAMQTLWGRASGLAPAVLFEVHPLSQDAQLARLNHANMVKIWGGGSYYTFHGTSTDALAHILNQGLNPTLNKRGNYGIGATYVTPFVGIAANDRYSIPDGEGCKAILVTHFAPGNAREVKPEAMSSSGMQLQHTAHNRLVMADTNSHSGFWGDYVRTSWKDPLLGQLSIEYLLCEPSLEKNRGHWLSPQWHWHSWLFETLEEKVEEYAQQTLQHEHEQDCWFEAEAAQKASVEEEVMRERRRHDEDAAIMLSIERSDEQNTLDELNVLDVTMRERRRHEEDIEILNEIEQSDELDVAICTERIIHFECTNHTDSSDRDSTLPEPEVEEHVQEALEHRHEDECARLLEVEAAQTACSDEEVMREQCTHEEDIKVLDEIEQSDELDLAICTERMISVECGNHMHSASDECGKASDKRKNERRNKPGGDAR